jgi:hypothetical protein
MEPRHLLQMNRSQLDALYGAGTSGPIPDGPAEGIALIASGTAAGSTLARLTRLFAWKGKTFYARHGVLTNRVSPFGINAIVALVYEDASWFDGKPCIALDYSKTSLVARYIRDEIRLIEPRLYLGKVFLAQHPVFGFALKFAA